MDLPSFPCASRVVRGTVGGPFFSSYSHALSTSPMQPTNFLTHLGGLSVSSADCPSSSSRRRVRHPPLSRQARRLMFSRELRCSHLHAPASIWCTHALQAAIAVSYSHGKNRLRPSYGQVASRSCALLRNSQKAPPLSTRCWSMALPTESRISRFWRRSSVLLLPSNSPFWYLTHAIALGLLHV